ncbi:MAG: hypothetical protein K2W95_18735 [Candidatus Obscuribacterales bacterium]|nr:hypothetical protein [Candidatus Obscuribacterales bacterium]
MANNTGTEERLDNNAPEAQQENTVENNDGLQPLDGDEIAAVTAHMFRGLMDQIQYAATAVAKGEAPRLQPAPSPMRHKEEIDPRNLYRDLPIWIQRAYETEEATEDLTTNTNVLEWLDRKSCKRKEYYDEFGVLEQLTGFYADLGRFDLGIKAAEKALAITNLHRQGDPEVISDLNWNLAQLNAANEDMERAERWLTKCVLLVEPGADSDSETYRGLLAQLKETFENARTMRAESEGQ